MRILIFNWRDIRHPHQGGAEKVTFEHAQAWVRAGHQVVWFCSAIANQKKEETISGIKIIRAGGELLTVYLAAFLWYLKYGRGQFDLVIDQFHGLPFFTPFYVKEKKLAFIHEITKEIWFLNPLPRPFNLFIGTFGYFLEPLVIKLYRPLPFLTVSESTKKDLISLGISADKITVINNGVRVLVPKKFPEKEKQPTLVFLGSLDKDKGIEAAIKAFGAINQQNKNFQFWVVGKGGPSYLKQLKSIAQRLKVKIKFFGFVSEEKKFELLAKAHLLINPSLREGWGLVVIEANSMGTPVIAYNSPGLRDSIINKKTGFICRKNTPEELAVLAINLIENKKLYCQLRKESLKWAKNFTWEQATQESLELIENLI